MNRVHIIGRKNHGKTTLVVELVRLLTSAGLRVGTIKHTHHRHELDTPGKDSFRHRQAGAAAVGILSQGLHAVFWPPHDHATETPTTDAERDDRRYDEFAPLMASCDLVIVEGDTQTRGAKVEVWRAAVGTQPLAVDDPSIVGVVTDDPLSIQRPVWPRRDLTPLADYLRTFTQHTR